MGEIRHPPTASAHYGKYIGFLFAQLMDNARCAVGQAVVERIAFEGKNTASSSYGIHQGSGCHRIPSMYSSVVA